MDINPLSVTKFVVSAIVGVGVGKIVGKAIKNTITPETLIEKVTVAAAAWVIGGIATEATKKYTDDMIDNIAKGVTAAVDNAKTINKVSRVNRGESTLEQEGLDPSRFKKDENNIWVFKKESEFIGDNQDLSEGTVRDLLNSGEWKYSMTDRGSWTKKSGRGKTWVLSQDPDTGKWSLSEKD